MFLGRPYVLHTNCICHFHHRHWQLGLQTLEMGKDFVQYKLNGNACGTKDINKGWENRFAKIFAAESSTWALSFLQISNIISSFSGALLLCQLMRALLNEGWTVRTAVETSYKFDDPYPEDGSWYDPESS